MERLFYSYEQDRLVTEAELRREYDSLDEFNKKSCFGEYIRCCLEKNGDLKEV